MTFLPQKNYQLWQVLCGIVILAVVGSPTRAESAGTKNRAHVITGEWPPLISEHADGGGPILKIVSEAFSAVNMTTTFEFAPWRQAINMLKNEQVDASAAWRLTPGRQASFYASGSVYQGPNVFFHMKSTPFSWDSLEDVAKYRVGGVSGYAYSVQFLELVERGVIQLALVNKEPQLVGMLEAGRIDVFPGNLDVVNYLIRKQFPNKQHLFTHDPRPFTEKPLHVIFPRNPEGKKLQERFDEGLETLKKTGRFKEIYLNYAAQAQKQP